MSVIVSDNGLAFGDPGAEGFCPPDELPPALAGAPGDVALALEPGAEIAPLRPHLGRIGIVRVAFPSHTDGRGFSIAAGLRMAGFQGRLRAAGPLIPDQFAALRAVGFDEVELPEDLLARHGEAVWRRAAREAGAAGAATGHQARLRQFA